LKAATLAKAKYDNGVYIVDNIKELDRIFMVDPRLFPHRYDHRWISHLKTDYSKKIGTKRLGYSVKRPLLRITPRQSGPRPKVEMLVDCEEGLLSDEEAIGDHWIPTPAEIKASAKAIREFNMANGIIRDTEYCGFNLQRTVERPMIALR
jgi:hypothetical protein